jgi:N-acetylglucosaminyl-diphospho-decaprenol L-rhamnosyltransferase
MPPDLSIVIVAHNRADLLLATIRSLRSHTHGLRYELIVIDSASTDPTITDLAHDPALRFVRLQTNRGYAAANNVGLRLAGGRYVALLNPDTLLHDDALRQLVRWLDAQPDVGAAGPQLRHVDGSPQPYSYGDAPTPRYLLRRWWARLRGQYLHAWTGTQPRDVGWIAGTCLVLRRAAIDAVGPLDEQFFLYFEDVDYGLRLRRAGWRVAWLPTTAITHVGGGSVGLYTSPHYDRSLVRLYAKHVGGGAAALVWVALRFYRAAQRMRGRIT